MMHSPSTGINISRYFIMVVVGFIFMFAFDFIVHRNLLMDYYEQSKNLWRSDEEMQANFIVMMIRNLLLIGIIGYIFTRHFEDKGIMEGFRFGIPMGLLLAIMMGSSYIWMPVPFALALGWAMSGLGIGLGLGIIFSLIYKQ